MTRIWSDDPAGLFTNVAAKNEPDIGTALNPLGTVYANSFVGNVTGDENLPNNTFLTAENAAGTGTLNLLKADATDNTVLNAKTGKVGKFEVNSVQIGTWDAASLTYPIFNLSDGADKNHSVTSFASGTAYALTATPAQLVFGTSNAQVVLDKAGTYLLLAKANLEYVGATFAANRTATLKLRRTNNTAADITGATTAVGTNIVTTVNGVLSNSNLPPVTYTTTNTNDIITIFGDVSVVPTAGALSATEANIVAIRLY